MSTTCTKPHVLPTSFRHTLILIGGVTLALLVNLLWVQRTFAQEISPSSPNAVQSIFPLAGLSLELLDPEPQPDGSIHANHAKLVAPTPFHGASRLITDVTVRKGVITIGGDLFPLPRFDFAGFALGLQGKLSAGPNGEQLISASGIFAVPHFHGLLAAPGSKLLSP